MTRITFTGLAMILVAASPVAAQNSRSESFSSRAQPAPNTLTAAEQRDGWKLLFDGKSLSQWRQYRGDSIPAGWQVIDGHLYKGRTARDIISREQFGDFELTFDWKLSETGNAGVFYRATEEYDRVYWSGPEYQLLDNIKAADNRTPLTRAAAVYGFYPAPDGHDKPSVFPVAMDTARGADGKPTVGRNGQVRMRERPATPEEIVAFFKAGEWNVAKIVARGTKVEHWLNGFLMGSYDTASDEWKAKVQESKFRPYPNFAKSPRGHIGLQGDHAGLLAFRNIKIRELK